MASSKPFNNKPERRIHLDLDTKYANTYFSQMYNLGQIISPSIVEFKNKRIGHLILGALPNRLNQEVASRNLQRSNLQIAPLTAPLNTMISQVQKIYALFDAVNDVDDSDTQSKNLQLLLHALIRSAQLVSEFEDRLSLWIKGERRNEHATITEAIYAICTARSNDLFARLYDQAFSCRSRHPFCATLREYCESTAMMVGEVEAWVEAQDSGSDTETEDTGVMRNSRGKGTSAKVVDEQNGCRK